MLHAAEVTREVNFEMRGNPWKLDSRAEALGRALGTSSHRTDNALKKPAQLSNQQDFFIFIFIQKNIYIYL